MSSTNGMNGAAGNAGMSAVEKRQLSEDFSPQGQYRIATKEAQAAYQDALKECRQSGSDRNSCMTEAKRNLQSDLAQAKQNLSSGR
ncbi:hypothetical protein [Noviherbaspirillum galbum]|uniref:Uncharacterized protein n=1 Tax=Noviherbaspirillum galbum TaxID=2709383 RepID=A0A6B3SHY5_9BURK|nr:hypothetical protein [Noviherbaspirillum galbum]NEX60421.1 hypothetical protein [Noviherbaspirillum galbum]